MKRRLRCYLNNNKRTMSSRLALTSADATAITEAAVIVVANIHYLDHVIAAAGALRGSTASVLTICHRKHCNLSPSTKCSEHIARVRQWSARSCNL